LQLYIVLFEPGKYLLRQVDLDLAGVGRREHVIYSGHEFIMHRVKG